MIDVKPSRGGHGAADLLVCADIVEMLKTGKKPIASPLAGRMSVAVVCSVTASLRNGSGILDISPVPDVLRTFMF